MIKKNSIIFVSFLFLFVIFLVFLFSSNLVKSVGAGDFAGCCGASDVYGATTANCYFYTSTNSSCAVGYDYPQDICYEASPNTISFVESFSTTYHLLEGGSCIGSCFPGEESCWTDGTHNTCIPSGTGTYSYSTCTGSYADVSAGYCEKRISDAFYCGYGDEVTCNNDGDCGWVNGTSSCSTLDKVSCGQTSGCTIVNSCQYNSSGGGVLPPSCSFGSTQCENGCADLNIDELNCGSCGIECNIDGGQICNSGSCSCPLGEKPVSQGNVFDSCSGGTYTQTRIISGWCKAIPPATCGPTQETCSGVGCNWHPQQSITVTLPCSGIQDENTCVSETSCMANYVENITCSPLILIKTCSDSDGGINSALKGTVTVDGTTTGTDFCTNNDLTEFSCSLNNNSISSIISCGSLSNCIDGACVSNSCSDSDGGTNYYSKGTVVTNTGINGTDFCSSELLTEYDCNSYNVGISSTHVCSDKCTSGACDYVLPSTPTAYFADLQGNKITTFSGPVPQELKLILETNQPYDISLYESDSLSADDFLGTISSSSFSGTAPYTTTWTFSTANWISGGSESISDLYFVFRDSSDNQIESSHLDFTRLYPTFYWGDLNKNPIAGTITAGTEVYLWAENLGSGVTSLPATIYEEDFWNSNENIKTITLTGVDGSLSVSWVPSIAEVLAGKDAAFYEDGEPLEFYFDTIEGDSIDNGYLFINSPPLPTTVYWANVSDYSTSIGGFFQGTGVQTSVAMVILDYDGGDFNILEKDSGVLDPDDGPWSQTSTALVDADEDGARDDWVGIFTPNQAILNQASLSEDFGSDEEQDESPQQTFEFEFSIGGLTSPQLLIVRDVPNLPVTAYWADPNLLSVPISNFKLMKSVKQLALVVLNYAGGENFTICEDDGWGVGCQMHFPSPDDGPWTQSSAGLVDADGDGAVDDWAGLWTMTKDILLIESISSDSDKKFEFYFDIAGVESSPFLNTSTEQGICGDGVTNTDSGEECDLGSGQNGAPGSTCDINCQSVGLPTYCVTPPVPTICDDYTTEDSCIGNRCDLNLVAPPPGTNPRCDWNGTECNFAYDLGSSEGKNIGYCVWDRLPGEDNCDDSLLSYSWTAEFNWNISNNYPTNLSCVNDGCSTSCIEVPAGTWRCDPENIYLSCNGGSKSIACPAQVKLDFFGWQNLIATIILILVIYFLIIKIKKKEKIKKKIVKKRK